jgi:beta-lactamase superfamily II metal-dependent hydrolase
MKRFAAALVSMAFLSLAIPAAQKGKTLDIYVIDAEGGKSVLYVSPSGETLLIDSGNAGGRDTDRLMAAITDAGVTKIDYLISTHYHSDHVGGLEPLSKRIPIERFLDHGPTVEGPVTALREQVAGFQAMYAELSSGKRTVVKPGDRVPIAGLDVRIVTSAGAVLKTPLPGGGKPNAACAKYTPPSEPASNWSTPDDDQSVGSVIAFGQFRAIDLGDLLWDRAVQLMCPNNMVGAIDLYVMTGHGTDITSASPLTDGIGARVAVMQNGTRKGGQVAAMQTIRMAPGFEDLWQLHWSYNAALEGNSPGLFVANIDDAATIAGVLTAPPRGGGPGRGQAAPAVAGAPPAAAAPAAAASTPPTSAAPAQVPAAAPPQNAAPPAAAGRGRGNAAAAHTPAYWIKVSAQSDGTFTVSNSRNGFTKTYAGRPAR